MRIRSKTEVIAAELRPGQGTWGVELAFPETDGLNKLLKLKTAEITKSRVEGELVRMPNGLHLLMTSNYTKGTNPVHLSRSNENCFAISRRYR